MNIEFDFSEAEALSASFGAITQGLTTEAHGVLAKGALNIKKDARSRVSNNPTWKHLASTINYDIDGLSAVVGYEDKGQGELAGIAEFGSARHAPHPALMPAMKAEAPLFEKAMLDAASRALGGLS